MQSSSTSVIAIMIAFLGTLLSFIIAQLPFELITKLEISLVFVVCSYMYIFRQIIRKRDYLSIYTILLLLSIPFYYGQHFVAVVSPSTLLTQYYYSILDSNIPDDYIIYATFLAIDCLLFLFAGYSKVKKTTLRVNDFDSTSQMNSLKFVGWIFLIISIYPAFHLLIAQYEMTVIHGYLGRRLMESEDDFFQMLGVSYIEILIGQLFLPAIYALLIAYKGKKYNKILMSSLVVYCILYMFTGSRFTLLKVIVSVVFIMYTWIKKPTKQDIRKLLVFGVLAAVFFTVGSIIRNVGVDVVKGSDVSTRLELTDTFWESGITFTTISNILKCCPSPVDFFYGKSVVGALLQCIPGASNLSFFANNSLHTSGTFSPLLYGEGTMAGYGSSFIAEGYYNFGYFVYFYIYILGVIFGVIRNSMIKAQNAIKPYRFLILVYICGEFAYAVRNDLCNIPRNVLLTVCVISFVAYFVNKLKVKS